MDARALVEQVALFAPEGERRLGRVSSTSHVVGEAAPGKVVLDFGSDAAGERAPQVEVATRRWEGQAAREQLRAFAAERALMEARVRDLAAPWDAGLEGGRWSERTWLVEGVPTGLWVVRTDLCWVGALSVPGFLVRVFTPLPGPEFSALRRIRSVGELEPVRGRG